MQNMSDNSLKSLLFIFTQQQEGLTGSDKHLSLVSTLHIEVAFSLLHDRLSFCSVFIKLLFLFLSLQHFKLDLSIELHINFILGELGD